MFKIYLYTIGTASLISFILFAADKLLSKSEKAKRVPEATMLFFACFGGAVGALSARAIFHHKTNMKTKFHFAIGLWTALVTQAALGVYIFISCGGIL